MTNWLLALIAGLLAANRHWQWKLNRLTLISTNRIFVCAKDCIIHKADGGAGEECLTRPTKTA